MESIHIELALYASKNECARTDTVFLPMSEVCGGTVSLVLYCFVLYGITGGKISLQRCLVKLT